MRERTLERKSGGGAGEKAVYMSADRIIVTKNRVMGTRGTRYTLNTGRDVRNAEKRLSVTNARGIRVDDISIFDTPWRNACTVGRRHYSYLPTCRSPTSVVAAVRRRECREKMCDDDAIRTIKFFIFFLPSPSIYGVYSRL